MNLTLLTLIIDKKTSICDLQVMKCEEKNIKFPKNTFLSIFVLKIRIP